MRLIFKILVPSLFLFSVAAAKIQVAVTIDDLPTHGMMPASATRLSITQQMLKSLKKHSVPEVYGFMNARKVENDPRTESTLKLWVENGYPLANHSFSHLSLSKISAEEFNTEVDKNEPALAKLNRGMNWKYFRYPFLREGESLEKRNAVRKHLKEKGYQIAQVTIDFEDWSWNEPFARCSDLNKKSEIEWLKTTYLKNAVDQLHRAETMSRALFKRPIKHILLLHIGAFDALMMDALLAEYKKEGVEFIPLSEAVKDEIYQFDPAVVGEFGSEFTFQVMKSRGLTLKDVGLEPYADFPEERLKTLCLRSP